MEKERVLIKQIETVVSDGTILATGTNNERIYLGLKEDGVVLNFIAGVAPYKTATAIYEGPVLLGFDLEG